MNHTIQKLVIKDDKFCFVAPPIFMFMFFIILSCFCFWGAYELYTAFGPDKWFYTCVVFGIIGIISSPSAFKKEYGFDWGAEKEGVRIRIGTSNKNHLWEWELVKEIVLMNSYRHFAKVDGKYGPVTIAKPISFLIDQSNYQKTFGEMAVDWIEGDSKDIDYIEKSYCGAEQEQIVEQLKKYAPAHVKIITHDVVDEIHDAANELRDSWLNK